MKKLIISGLLMIAVIIGGCGSTGNDKDKEPGEPEGTFEEAGDGKYEFVSYSENVKGIIRMNGWEGASFEVTESADSPFTVGDIFEFGFAF